MKNWKKIVAAFAAATMIMSIGSVAFASANGSASINEDKDVVSVEWDTLDASNQWTVIIIDKANENKSLEARDLHYINQGTTSDGFWTAMGTKSTLTDGDYIVRIGGSNLVGYKDIPLTVSTSQSGQTELHLYGDVDGSEEVDLDDAMEIIFYYNFMDSVFDDYLDDDTSWIWVAGDVDESGEVDLDDTMEIIYYYNFMDSVFDSMESDSFEM